MKSLIFTTAIRNRLKLRFLYNMEEIILEPYYISKNKSGRKVIYGRVNNSSEVAMFEYNKICNIRVFDYVKFSPIIPILPVAS